MEHRLLFSIHSAYLGGAARTQLDLMAALAERHEVALIWSGARFDVAQTLAETHPRLTAPVHELALAGYSKWQPWRYAASVARYRRILAAVRPDAAIHRGFQASRTLGWPTRLAGVRSVAYLADVWPLTRITRWMLAGNHFFTGISRSAASMMPAPGRRMVLNPGFDLERIDAKPVAELPIPKRERLWLGAVGELVPWKGHRHAIEALARLKAHRGELALVLVGDDRCQPGYQAELESLAEQLGVRDMVHFAGYQQDVWSWYRRFDVMLHPTEENEAFGRVLAEAALCGLPLVGTATGGVVEIIEDGRNGYLIEPKAPSAFADAIGRLVDDAALRTRLGAEARRLARERYSIDRAVTRMEALLGALVDGETDRLEGLAF